jgi:hypothetical protein
MDWGVMRGGKMEFGAGDECIIDKNICVSSA